jgi:hypothetical protein
MTYDNKRAATTMNKPTITAVVCVVLLRIGLGAGPTSAMPVGALAAMSGEFSADVQRVGSDCGSYGCGQSNSHSSDYSVPTYGYTYGPAIDLAYFAAPALGCPVLSLDGYWKDRTKRRAIAVVKKNQILIR